MTIWVNDLNTLLINSSTVAKLVDIMSLCNFVKIPLFYLHLTRLD